MKTYLHQLQQLQTPRTAVCRSRPAEHWGWQPFATMLQSYQASQGKLHAHTEEFLYSKIRKHSAHGLMGVTQSTNEGLKIKWSNPQMLNLPPVHTHTRIWFVCFFFLFLKENQLPQFQQPDSYKCHHFVASASTCCLSTGVPGHNAGFVCTYCNPIMTISVDTNLFWGSIYQDPWISPGFL